MGIGKSWYLLLKFHTVDIRGRRRQDKRFSRELTMKINAFEGGGGLP
jgi:hypothetical protein